MLGEGVCYSEVGPGKSEEYNFFSLFSNVERNSTRYWMLALYSIIRSNDYKDLVEIGIMYGVTSSVLARAAKHNRGRLVCIDIDEFHIERTQRQLYWNELSQFVTIIQTPSEHVSPFTCDFVFIDADHSYEGVSTDWRVWHPHLRIGGTIAFHDTQDQRVKKFLNETFPREGWEFINWPGDCGLALARRVA